MSDTRDNSNDREVELKALPGLLPTDRPQPHDSDAERAILAAMLLEPQYCVGVAIEKLRGDDVFYSPVNRIIYQSILSMEKKSIGVDVISLAHVLSQDGRLEEIGGKLFLAELQNSIATTANMEGWCEIVNQFAILRGMISVCAESMQSCYSPEEGKPVDLLLDELEMKILKVRETTNNEVYNLVDLMPAAFQRLQDVLNGKVEPGLPTGFAEVDKMTAGLKPGDMFVLAARPSIGKTSLGLNILSNIALRGIESGDDPLPVAFFSLEMTELQITTRLLCSEAQISERAFHDGSFNNADMPKLTRAVTTLKKAKIFIDPTPSLKILELRSKARRLHQQHDIKLIIIDYLQLMKAPGCNSRQEEVAEISGGVKAIAKELGVPVLILAQLNRDTEKAGATGPVKPKLSSLRESGAIEQDADVVAFLHRDRDAQKNITEETLKSGIPSEIIIEKNRNGETGISEVLFFPQFTQFRNKSHRYGDDDAPQGL